MTVFEPIRQEPRDPAPADPSSVIAVVSADRRWVRIRRPVVMVGGELTLDMLDLRFNPTAKFYEAPIQLKANGGGVLRGDFGRQRIRPQDLLYRWSLPPQSHLYHPPLPSRE